MRNKSKGIDIGSCFPIMGIENGFIVNKAAEVTAAYRVTLPEIFTLQGEEYETMHSSWLRALRVLPEYTVLHKQDWFTRDTYRLSRDRAGDSFLERGSERYFHERPFLDHNCYLFITKTWKGRDRVNGVGGMLMRGHVLPRELDAGSMDGFRESVDQFERIMNDSGLVTLSRLGAGELLGDDRVPGLFERHLSLSQGTARLPMEDMLFEDGGLRIGDKRVCTYTISGEASLPVEVSTDSVYGPFTTEASEYNLSFPAQVGILLPFDHVYNQYVFIEDSREILRELESEAGKMHSMSLVSSENGRNEEAIQSFLDTAGQHRLLPVRAHVNVMAWSESREEIAGIGNMIGSAMSAMGCERVRQDLVNGPVLYWSSIPGNAGDFPREETFLTFAENALCFFSGETNYKDSPSPFGIKMTDRLTGRPVHVDLSETWMERGIIHNRNKFVLGGSGSGKSFFMNHMLRQYYEQGSHVILVDMGDSYEGLCKLVNARTGGSDGLYFTYTDDNPISFNPFYTDDNVYDIEKREGSEIKPSEDVTVSNAMAQYLELVTRGDVKPSFNTFYEFVRDSLDITRGFEELMERNEVTTKEIFDIVNFLYVLAPYYRGGEYDYLLNSDRDLDLLDRRLIVFEIDKIRDNKVLFPVVTLVIMEAYINKMRRRREVRKVLVLEEAWKAIARDGMASYVKYLYKTVRKYFGEVTVVTQEMDDIISSEVVKESIIANADCKILLDQSKNLKKFDRIRDVLGLTEKNKTQILSMNRDLRAGRGKYKEVWIGWGGNHSAVYATEVSPEEYYTYCDQRDKLLVKERTREMGGDMEAAIRSIISERQ